ncbi:hypothetical protein FOIG_02263 [Fusarium odoratissimum NRRL 54006]|uniref:Uncharacterized protein n=2 Tax=Fusarium oxysporum species complex TaxID=171631 RepID=X0K7L4_FUSO5|nr:uncharacterized protein FOIG_02263 [Fusarium odoratissimum NRRL 54006]EXM09438.1 hypothetical protein FOIG_02263 [Fusarium odoratissimum NRRL 54006]TXC06406.1 hypothetical protein FocTR4_00010146 [Fusarium oxysporum f. sp. cubense]
MRLFLSGYQYYVNPTWHVTDWKKQGEGISMLIKTENTQDVVGCSPNQYLGSGKSIKAWGHPQPFGPEVRWSLERREDPVVLPHLTYPKTG